MEALKLLIPQSDGIPLISKPLNPVVWHFIIHTHTLKSLRSISSELSPVNFYVDGHEIRKQLMISKNTKSPENYIMYVQIFMLLQFNQGKPKKRKKRKLLKCHICFLS